MTARPPDNCGTAFFGGLLGKNGDRRILLMAHRTGRSLVLALLFGLCAPGFFGCRGKSIDDYLAEGDKAFRDNNLATAEQDYIAAEKAAPNDARTHAALGNLYAYENNPDVAIGEFNETIRLDPRNSKGHAGLGKIYADRNQFGPAEEQYRAAIILDPAVPTSHMGLAWVLERVGKHDEAERELRTAIGLAPHNAQAHFALANLLAAEHGRQAEAEAEYSQAHTLDPRLNVPGATPAAPAAAAAATPATRPAPPAEATPPAEAAAPASTPAAAASSAPVKPLNKKFLLGHDSPVYESPRQDSEVVAQVHRGKFVHVVGITGNWLQIKMRTGIIGFIPASVAE